MKIDKTLFYKIYSCSDPGYIDVVIFFSPGAYKQVFNRLSSVGKDVRYFEFIKAFCVKLKPQSVMELSRFNIIEYITSLSSVTTLMDIARNTINVEGLYSQNIFGQNQTLAVIDTGISPHMDILSFNNRIVCFKDFINNKQKMYDDNGHGTFVSGVALGNGFTSMGKYSGVAPMSNLVMLKALDKSGESDALNILSAMEWIYLNASDYNIGVVCMSFGSTPFEKNDPLVMGANALWDKGIIVVAAAGNSGPAPRTIKSPGVSNHIITVGGIDDRVSNHFVPDFSSRGPAYSFYKPDVVAPGVDVTSTNYTMIAKEPYTVMSGTSVATPIVAGATLLLKQKYPYLSCAQIKKLITNNAIVLPQEYGGGRNKQGYGVLNLKLKGV